MIPFILLAAAFTFGALMLILPPLLGRGGNPATGDAEQAATVLEVLREQLAELEAELAAGRIDAATHARQKEELEARALAEGQAAQATAARGPARSWALLTALAAPLLAIGLYLSLGNPDGLDPAKVAGNQGFTPQQVESMVAGLAEKLKGEPDNLEGWMMLARSYTALERYAEAAAAYAHLAQKLPDEAQILIDWADVLGASQGRSLLGEPEKLIARALALAPQHPKALALAGSAAFEKGDYAGAAARWEAVLGQIPPEETEIIGNIRASIGEARKRAGLPPLAALPTIPMASAAAPAASPATAAPGGAVPQASAAGGLRLQGEIRLAPALAAQARPDDSVFVFVRGAAGGPPLAAQRHRVADLPLQFDFSQTPLMLGEAPLPAEVRIGARVSRSGNPAASSGDLEGYSAAVAPDARGLSVQIDQVRP